MKWVDKEIDILKSLENKYLIKYFDAFNVAVGNTDFQIWHVITEIYVKFIIKLKF